ncbi:MAG: phosphate ABC transporter substrate-binding protein PstS [Rhodoplanes sp.]|nr:phosphate ABC transporter substrate-binding protein PstS [Rhodoplanes sp.]
MIAAVALSIGFPVAASWAQGAGPAAPVSLRGAGATFPAPLYKKWISIYQASHPKVSIAYEAVGSGEGVKRLLAESVDFAASDEVLNAADAAKVGRGAATVPATAGMIVLAYNIPGVTGEIKLPRDVYVGIFAGTIQRWNDPRIVAANPGIRLPARDIAVVARLDSSGTTAAFTRHLAAAHPSWGTQGLGVGKLVGWPGKTMLAAGNEGVAARIKVSEGAIGYVEFGFAKRLGLPMAALENKSGAFVTPSEAAAQLALSARVVQVSELDRSVVDPTAAGAYPIVSYSWLFLFRRHPDPARGQAVHDLVAWGLSEGQQYGAELGYIPLSADVIALGREALQAIAY